MALLRLIPYGARAALSLREAIVEAKGGDPLAPVKVAVPSNYAGLSLRRTIGSGDLSLAAVSGRDGLVNVRFDVLARVAELLGPPALAGQQRRPLSGAVRAEAVRAALAAEPGVFRDVADHVATERSLEATFRDLRQAPPQALDAVARGSERAADVVRLFHDFRRRTEPYYDEEDEAMAAAEAVRERSPALRDVGYVILYLPRRLSPGERALVLALAEAGGVSALIGLTGDPEADAPSRALASRLDRALGPAEECPALPAPAGTSIVAVSDAEEELRAVLRLVTERLADGMPLHRMAVLYPSAHPYALLAHEQFRAAGVPHSGPAVRTLAQTLSGRTLLGLLRLREADMRRDVLMDWLSGAPVLEQARGSHAPAQRWDVLSRSAGVVGGPDQWRQRLAEHRRSLDRRRAALERMDEGNEWQVRRLDADIGHLERLARFIEELTAITEPGPLQSWAEFVSWARGLLERYLGREGPSRDLPEDEKDKVIEAHRAVGEALDALSNLGDVRPQTDEATFRRALERELEAPAGRFGHFGEGVFIGRVRDAVGTDFDSVFLLGMTEGAMPARGRDDPLLPDRERSAAGDDMPLKATRPAEERRDYLAALAAAPERVLIFPRADLRGQRGKLPARWLLETASQLEGRSVFSSDLEALPPRPWFTVVPSFESALVRQDKPASEQEYGLGSLLRWRRAGANVLDHYLVKETAALGAGIAADLARQGAGLTCWDGRLQAGSGLAPSADRPVSPTALQDWAACPFRYLLGHVFRVAETEKPEEALTISALERGNLYHDALETFVGETPTRTTSDQAWSADERARLMEIARRLCDEADAAGLTGKPLLWRLERERILRDIAGFLDADERMREEHGTVPVAVEHSFGVRGAPEPTVRVALVDGREVAFRGRIDRVDRAPDGSRLMVLDYKSGSAARYARLKVDPFQQGKLLQLPVYALAAAQAFGDSPASAYYWFITEDESYDRKGGLVDEGALGRFREIVAVIVDGIESGLFPARPGKSRQNGFENCLFCPYDRVCQRDRGRDWRRKRGAPDLEDYVELAEPED